MSILAIIPFRRQSARIPEKIYKTIGGAELCVTVCQRVVRALSNRSNVQVIAAVDDVRTRDLLKNIIPAECVVLTDPALPSGTDRVFAAASQHCNRGGKRFADLRAIVNIQGDMPFLSASALDNFIGCVERWDLRSPYMLTPYEPWPADLDAQDLGNVKIVCDDKNRALYFSRYPVPCSKNFDPAALKLHVGIYAFTPAALEAFCTLPACALEQLEGLEQLRALYAGIPIECVGVRCLPGESFRGIDTPGDLDWAARFAEAT